MILLHRIEFVALVKITEFLEFVSYYVIVKREKNYFSPIVTDAIRENLSIVIETTSSNGLFHWF